MKKTTGSPTQLPHANPMNHYTGNKSLYKEIHLVFDTENQEYIKDGMHKTRVYFTKSGAQRMVDSTTNLEIHSFSRKITE